ncbi:Diphthine--ammonia ligase [Portunus trituberculatus]|uniref:Diphthine--ammonia ligase n=1 Tax=Portunus trituberculatus TaxID=210409 RepID=A0A5B7CT26_PORTR|nr:Diphthine--ammonia ligase [Portunus trituberculatus]
MEGNITVIVTHIFTTTTTTTDELDSYMYQSVGHMGVEMYAEAVGVPLFRRVIQGSSLNTTSITYNPTEGDEVEDLYLLLKEVQGVCFVTRLSDVGVARRMMARLSESQISTYVVVPALPRGALHHHYVYLLMFFLITLTRSPHQHHHSISPWYSGTMCALGSEGSPSTRVRILSTVRV